MYTRDQLEQDGVESHTGLKKGLVSGDYAVMISKAEVETNKRNNGDNVVMEYSVLAGEFAGSEAKEWLAVTNPSDVAQGIARSKLMALFDVTKTNDIPALVGKNIMIRMVVTENGTYVDNKGETRPSYDRNVANYMTMDMKDAKGNDVAPFVASEEKPKAQGSSGSGGTGGTGGTGGSYSESGQAGGSSRDLDDRVPF